MDSKHFNDKKGGEGLDRDDFNAILRVLLTLRRWRNESSINAKAKVPDESVTSAVNAVKSHKKAVEKP
jgi:hypothetical protein